MLGNKLILYAPNLTYPPLVFSTLVNNEAQQIIEDCDGFVISLFHHFIGSMETFLGVESSQKLGVSRISISDTTYQKRLDAIDYALTHDDGIRPDQYEEADVILVGVSRCGKTPTSLYLAMNFSLKVANYPLTVEDLEAEELPEYLKIHKHKLAGLTIKPVPLSRIRRQRRPDSNYSSLEICQAELDKAMIMFEKIDIPVLIRRILLLKKYLAVLFAHWGLRVSASANQPLHLIKLKL